MSMKFFKIIWIIVGMAILLSLTAFAVEPRTSQYIYTSYASAIKERDGNLKIEFTLSTLGTMKKIGASKIEVYKSDDTLVETFKYTVKGYEDMMGSNASRYSSSVNYSGASGQKYYAVVTFYASNSSGSDSVTYTTATVTA